MGRQLKGIMRLKQDIIKVGNPNTCVQMQVIHWDLNHDSKVILQSQ